MKVTKFLFGAMCALLITSCQSKKSEWQNIDDVKVNANGVEGKNANLISISSEQCTLSAADPELDKEKNNVTIKVTLKLNDWFSDINDTYTEVKDLDPESYSIYPQLRVYDQDGDEIESFELGTGSLGSTAGDEFKKFLKADLGTEQEFIFSANITDNEQLQKLFAKAKTFKITDIDVDIYSSDSETSGEAAEATEEVGSGSDDESNSDYESSSSSSSSSDWDEALDSYEKYVNKLTTLYKKAAKGDISAVTEYTSLMSEIESLTSKMDGAKGEMTQAQLNRYLRITNKMTQSIGSL